ncbi:MAG: amidase [Thiotrichales bacterium]|mgnify:CR=1 FL=1|nr:amidase [Thiotrichales bacterium]
MTLHDQIELYRSKRCSPVEVMRQTLERIDRVEPMLNAFQLVDADTAMEIAQASEQRWLRGEPVGVLDGLPVAIKDLTLTKGWPTRGGSLTTNVDREWNDDAPSVARLREAGAIIFGKTTTPEFGWKGLTDSPLAGFTRNPWDPKRSSGGSSGGAAASLAAGIGAFAHASDGGGSIRIPASYCGLFGFKPSFGRVPAYPRVGAFATLSSEGAITRCVDDSALLLNVMSRVDSRDWYALPSDDVDYMAGLDSGVAGLRVGVCVGLGGANAAADIVTAVESAAQVFEQQGAQVETVESPFTPLRPVFERYWLATMASRVLQVPEHKRDLLDPDLVRVAEPGKDVTLAEYGAAMSARAELGATMNAFHRDFDLLLTPTMPTDPPPAETTYHTAQFDRWDHAVPYTVPFNFTGQPAASIPCGLSQAGLPIGLQIIGPARADQLVLRACKAFEHAHPIPVPPDMTS